VRLIDSLATTLLLYAVQFFGVLASCLVQKSGENEFPLLCSSLLFPFGSGISNFQKIEIENRKHQHHRNYFVQKNDDCIMK